MRSCHQKRELWAEWAEQELLEDACAWRVLKLYFDACFDGADVTPGAIGFLQTAGELLTSTPMSTCS